ncbi:MAG: hypothetical protein KIT14_00110 [bacterium]|nr:hypothetical protein [bacterium]
MHRWLVIGLLRDGVARSQDGIATAYRERTGVTPDREALHAELRHLVAKGVLDVAGGAAAPAYRLGADGAAAFDIWLTAPAAIDEDDDERVTSRLLLLGEVSPADAAQLLGRWERELWERARTLERARTAAVADAASSAQEIAVRPALLERLLERVAADLATLAELRRAWEAWRTPSRTP